MTTIIKDDCIERIIDERGEPLDPTKYPNIVKTIPEVNDVRKDKIGFVDGHRPVYALRYVWETLFAPADLDREESKLASLAASK